jgi:hypothetical protein
MTLTAFLPIRSSRLAETCTGSIFPFVKMTDCALTSLEMKAQIAERNKNKFFIGFLFYDTGKLISL